jgi:hypothetical protein
LERANEFEFFEVQQYREGKLLGKQRRPIFNGIPYRHIHIPVDKNNSTCYD